MNVFLKCVRHARGGWVPPAESGSSQGFLPPNFMEFFPCHRRHWLAHWGCCAKSRLSLGSFPTRVFKTDVFNQIKI